MDKGLLFVTAVLVGFAFAPAAVQAAAPFYEGKTIRIIVGSSPGGGQDLSARLTARYIGNHIPGKPTIMVENMPGAGGLTAANTLYGAIKPDGLTIGTFMGSNLAGQVFGQPGVKFDAKKFEYLGFPTRGHTVAFFMKKSGITSMEKWMASTVPVKMAGNAPGNNTPDNVTRILKYGFALPINLVSGYRGSPEMRLACETGEVDGIVWSWVHAKWTWQSALAAGDVIPVLQVTPKSHPDLTHVPLATKYAKTSEAQQLLNVVYAMNGLSTPFLLPPGTPKERVEALRKAYSETLRDEEYLQAAQKSNMDIYPGTGQETQEAIATLFNLDAGMRAKLKKILYD